jgi:hypothetical protein
VRVLDVHIPPGDTSQFHIHARPSVFVILNHAHTGSQVLSQGQTQHIAGDIYFEGFYDQPRIHRVWNEDNFEFRVMDIELMKDHYQDAGQAISDTSFKEVFDEKPVRAYQLTLNPGQKITLEKRRTPLLFINLSESATSLTVNLQTIGKQSQFFFEEKRKPVYLSNGGPKAAKIAVLEFK